MHVECDLGVLASKLSQRVARLRQALNSQSNSYDAKKGVYLGYIVIEAANAWSLYARSALVSSALGARTVSGYRVTSSRGRWPSEADIIVDATLIAKPWLGRNGRPSSIARRDEPAWHDAYLLQSMWAGLQLSNAQSISQALSLGATFYADLPPTRNFFAHKNKDTASTVVDIARRYGISPIIPFTARRRSVPDLVTSVPTGRPQSVIAEWLDELETTAELMAM
ncbi:hypothetical protein MSAS_14450 [Mycobacterium saskatchewanense]|nr:hypothetical protein MSAS_14450 [Mycobacterium saskatchewanense]